MFAGVGEGGAMSRAGVRMPVTEQDACRHWFLPPKGGSHEAVICEAPGSIAP